MAGLAVTSNCAIIIQNYTPIMKDKAKIYDIFTGQQITLEELSQKHGNPAHDDSTRSNVQYDIDQFLKDLQRHFGVTEEDARRFIETYPHVGEALRHTRPPSTALAAVPPGEERLLITRRDLPEEAPALWARDKQPGDTPPDFIQRHYGPWIGNGLSRPDIDRYDHTLYVTLGRWLEKPSNSLPFDLPSKRELMEREASRLVPEEVRETQRQLSRQQRRLRHISRDRV